MYLVTLTLDILTSENQADEMLKKILRKVSEQKPETLSAVKEKTMSGSVHYHVLISEKNNMDSVFANWLGRVKIHTVTNESAKRFLHKDKNATFSY